MEESQKYRVKGQIKAGDNTIIEVEEVVYASSDYTAKAIVLEHVYSKVNNSVYWKKVTVTKNE